MRILALLLAATALARADTSAPAPPPSRSALSLEPAHGPYRDFQAYRDDFLHVDPRGLYFFLGGNEAECDRPLPGAEALAGLGLEARSFTLGGGNGECQLGIRRAPDGPWFFLETGGAYTFRKDSSTLRIAQVRPRGAFVVEVATTRRRADGGDDCDDRALACVAERSGAFACRPPLPLRFVERCRTADGAPIASPSPRYAMDLRFDGEVARIVARRVDPSLRALPGAHPVLRGPGDAALEHRLARPRNSDYWTKPASR